MVWTSSEGIGVSMAKLFVNGLMSSLEAIVLWVFGMVTSYYEHHSYGSY